MDELLSVLAFGLLLGGIYGLVGVGVNLIFGVVRIVNFAHGELIMVSMYLTYYFNHQFGLSPYLAILIVTPAMFLLGAAIQRLIMQPLQSEPMMQMFAGMQRDQMGMFGGMHRDQMSLVREELDALRALSNEMDTIKAQLAARPQAPVPPPFGGFPRATNGQHAPFAPRAPEPPPAEPPPPMAPPIEPAPDVHDWLNERLSAIGEEQQTRMQRLMSMIRGGK